MKKKFPKIKNLVKYEDDIYDENPFGFKLMDYIMHPKGHRDNLLMDRLIESGCLEKMLENLRANYNNKRMIDRYMILLDNHNWIEGRCAGRDN